jgi:hypothetical protein
LVLERLEEAQGARKEAEVEKRGLRTRLDGVKRELQKLQVGAGGQACPLSTLTTDK